LLSLFTQQSVSYYLISPAISNGLSFNKKTGTISGVPIVASDSVTYTVTAVGRWVLKSALLEILTW
jgi:hypothetical protein